MMGQGVRSSNGQTDSCGGTCLNHLSWLPKIHVSTLLLPPPHSAPQCCHSCWFPMLMESPAVSSVRCCWMPIQSWAADSLSWSLYYIQSITCLHPEGSQSDPCADPSLPTSNFDSNFIPESLFPLIYLSPSSCKCKQIQRPYFSCKYQNRKIYIWTVQYCLYLLHSDLQCSWILEWSL